METQYTLLGDARMQCDAGSFVPNAPYICITRAMPDQRGGFYCKRSIQLDDRLKGIQVEFAFRVSNQSGQAAENGADGFAFVIQAQSEYALGRGGCEMGYGGIRNR